MGNILLILVLVVLFILALFILPQWRMRRAIRQVVETFRKNDTTQPSTAKTLEQLGLGQEKAGSFALFRRKDYKIFALDILIRAQAVQQLEDGRLYLLEEKLWRFRL